jgi:hypothetical protein
MTAFRLISLPTHGAAELALGLLVLVSPVILGFGPAGTVLAIALGAIVCGRALAAADPEVAIRAHHASDYGVALLMLAGALALALAGDTRAAAGFVVAAGAQLGLNGVTRYSARA